MPDLLLELFCEEIPARVARSEARTRKNNNWRAGGLTMPDLLLELFCEEIPARVARSEARTRKNNNWRVGGLSDA